MYKVFHCHKNSNITKALLCLYKLSLPGPFLPLMPASFWFHIINKAVLSTLNISYGSHWIVLGFTSSHHFSAEAEVLSLLVDCHVIFQPSLNCYSHPFEYLKSMPIFWIFQQASFSSFGYPLQYCSSMAKPCTRIL